jgi:hypothetical protein
LRGARRTIVGECGIFPVVQPGMTTPKSRPRKKALTLPGMAGVDRPTVAWFAKYGCVVRDGERRTLVIANRQVGSWEPGEGRIRNALMVQLASDPTIVLEDLAKAFDVSSETLRLQRRLFETKGLAAVLASPEPHHRGGRPIEPALRRQMERLFKQGKSTAEVAAALAGQTKHSTVEKYRRLWKQKQAKLPKPAQQAALPLEAPNPIAQVDRAPEPKPEPVPEASGVGTACPPMAVEAAQGDELLPPIRAPRQETSERVARPAPVAEPAPPEPEGTVAEIGEFAPFSSKGVQHVGAWLLLITIASLGLYAHLRRHERRRPQRRPLRVAVDAVLSTLGIGGKCVEGVRRLATSTMAAMILADAAPSATWVRRTLGGYCAEKEVSEQLLKDVSGELLRGAKERRPRGKPVVLFFDNHGRPYTGMHELRRIWRMQSKCTVPGAMEYWVHDAEGRPVLLIPVAPNASLPDTVKKWVAFLREKLGKETPLLLVFDRAGAFPGLWKWLQDNGVQFVTYQRARYRKFRREWFRRHGRPMTLRDADGKKVKVMVQEGRMNLGAQRGRVRRIRILMPDDVQMNVVASSKQSAKWLCQTLFTRWRQENAFKHGVERWGVNQLDGRQVEDVPAGTMVTNPRRTTLEKALREAKEREKKLRLQLQQMYPGHPVRRELKSALKANRAGQRDLVKARRETPKKVPIEQTVLQGELKQHKGEYKLLIDTLRCVAQNAEAELAAVLAPNLPVPGEAKRLLQNVFSAPGDIRVSGDAITVCLDPAANRPERAALEEFFTAINRRRLCHPGDPFSRPVRFRLQTP